MEPEILVLDEPATDLDPRGRKEVFSLSHLLREKGRTVLLVDPDPESAVDADQVWLMNGGEILARGRPSEILGNRSLMKSSGMTPHPLVELFEELGWSGRPLTFEEAKESIQKDQRVQPKRVEPRPFSPRGTPSAPVLKVENLTYHYPVHGIEALRGIDLHIAGGEFIALLGQNGSGKTTLAKHLNGLLKPSSGQVLVDGKPTTRYPRRELARRVGYVFQNPDHQIFAKTVWEEVGFGLKMLGESPGRMEERVGKALEAVGLSGYETRMPFTLTKGERQRVAVASVLAAQPQVILLDEPTTGLDPVQQRGMMEMLVRLNQAGHTILIITHSMEIAAAYADRTVVMKGGSILLDGPTRSVFFDEENLAEASLFPPLLVRLSNWLGTRALTVRQMVEELKP
jgi:energy-coupling factor transport system ATP-binding protein